MKRRAVLFAMSAAAASVGAVALKPRTRASEVFARIDLASQVPDTFGEWRLDRSMVPVLPDPALQAKLDQIYTQVMAKTYAGPGGTRVMLSIAYGADQGSDATAVHRPEFCYSAQGFSIRSLGEQRLNINGHALDVRRLVARLGARTEPISYWVTLNDRAVLPGAERKLEQIRLGLLGQIPDGMLVRVSNIGAETSAGFALHDAFIATLERSMVQTLRPRYFGSGA